MALVVEIVQATAATAPRQKRWPRVRDRVNVPFRFPFTSLADVADVLSRFVCLRFASFVLLCQIFLHSFQLQVVHHRQSSNIKSSSSSTSFD